MQKLRQRASGRHPRKVTNRKPPVEARLIELGRSLQRRRLDMNISQDWVAEVVKYHRVYVSRIENGHVRVEEAYQNLSRALDAIAQAQQEEPAHDQAA